MFTICLGMLLGLRHLQMAGWVEPRMSIVFQETGLFPWRNVHDNIAFGLETADMKADEKERCV